LSQAIPTALLSRAWIITGDLLSVFVWWLVDAILLPKMQKSTRA
jgi:hypothetical protein